MSDYMQETERLLLKVIDTSADVVCASDEWTNENDDQFRLLLERAKEARAALLAHIERGRVCLCKETLDAAPAAPDHSATVPNSPEDMWNALHRIDSAAAMLPTYSVKHEGGLDAFAQNIIDAIQGIAAATVPAEVPMPEQDSECTHQDDHLYPVWNREQMQQYGDAREAAGYARGLEAAAVIAWMHYMDKCRSTRTPAASMEGWCASSAIRAAQKGGE